MLTARAPADADNPTPIEPAEDIRPEPSETGPAAAPDPDSGGEAAKPAHGARQLLLRLMYVVKRRKKPPPERAVVRDALAAAFGDTPNCWSVGGQRIKGSHIRHVAYAIHARADAFGVVLGYSAAVIARDCELSVRTVQCAVRILNEYHLLATDCTRRRTRHRIIVGTLTLPDVMRRAREEAGTEYRDKPPTTEERAAECVDVTRYLDRPDDRDGGEPDDDPDLEEPEYGGTEAGGDAEKPAEKAFESTGGCSMIERTGAEYGCRRSGSITADPEAPTVEPPRPRQETDAAERGGAGPTPPRCRESTSPSRARTQAREAGAADSGKPESGQYAVPQADARWAAFTEGVRAARARRKNGGGGGPRGPDDGKTEGREGGRKRGRTKPRSLGEIAAALGPITSGMEGKAGSTGDCGTGGPETGHKEAGGTADRIAERRDEAVHRRGAGGMKKNSEAEAATETSAEASPKTGAAYPRDASPREKNGRNIVLANQARREAVRRRTVGGIEFPEPEPVPPMEPPRERTGPDDIRPGEMWAACTNHHRWAYTGDESEYRCPWCKEELFEVREFDGRHQVVPTLGMGGRCRLCRKDRPDNRRPCPGPAGYFVFRAENAPKF